MVAQWCLVVVGQWNPSTDTTTWLGHPDWSWWLDGVLSWWLTGVHRPTRLPGWATRIRRGAAVAAAAVAAAAVVAVVAVVAVAAAAAAAAAVTAAAAAVAAATAAAVSAAANKEKRTRK